MKSVVQRWGNSLALRIPKAYAVETSLEEGSEVELSLKAGTLVVQPIRRKKQKLATLLKQITPDNLHSEVRVGPIRGREVW